MSSPSPLINKIVSGGLILALVCWFAGAAVRDCCAKGAELADGRGAPPAHLHASNSTEEVSEAHCARPEHCQKENVARPENSFADSSSCALHPQMAEAMPCCSLSAQAFAGAQKLRLVPDQLDVVEGGACPRPSSITVVGEAQGGKSFLPDGGETYLRGCVFLI